MFFDYALTLPANGASDDPTELEVKLAHGVVTHVEVEFPPGCAGLVYAYVRRGLYQVWPSNPDGQFKTDGRAIVWADYYEIFAAPFNVTVGGWNTDDTFAHEITFRFEITPREVAERMKQAASAINKIRTILRL